jgi:hypothetical protein
MAIPESFENSERIVRVLYFPKYVKNDKKTIKSGAFRPPADFDEISVIRLNYSSADFCKSHGKKNEKPDDERIYFGLCVIKVEEIKFCGADIKFTPDLPDNPAHSDITIGFVPIRGQQLPSKYQLKVDELARKARLHEDPNPTALAWVGGELI